MSPFLTCDVAFQHFFFERLVGIKDYNSWRCLSRAFFQCFVNGSVVRRRFSTYWMIALAWLQKWWWEDTAWKAQERSKEGYFMILWSIIGSYTFWVHANSIWQWSEGGKRWRKSERASSKGASKHILHFDMGIVPQGMLRPQFNMSAYCTTFTILQSNTIITTRSGQGQTNLPLDPPRFGLVKITGGLIENMILRKTRALASAPGLQLGMVNLLNIYSIAQALDSVHSPSWQLRFSVRNFRVLQNEGVVRGMLKKEHQLGASCKAWIVPAIMNRKTPHKTRFEVHSKIIKGSRYNKNLQESLPRWKTNWSLALKAGGMASIMPRPMRNVCGKPWSCSIPGRVIQLPHGGGQGITFYWKDYTNSIKETLGFW